jgi:hypothetical protein
VQNNKEKGKIEVVRISKSDASSFMRQYHYLETVPGGSRSFALLRDGEVVAVICIQLHESMIEMTRFMLLNNEKNFASQSLAVFLKFVKENFKVKCMITYADPNIGHTGTIYKAVGGKCMGQGRDTIGFVVGDRVISGRNLSYAMVGKEKGAIPIRLKGKLKFMFSW